MKKTHLFLTTLLFVYTTSLWAQEEPEPYYPLLTEGKMWVEQWGGPGPCTEDYPYRCCVRSACKVGKQVTINDKVCYEILYSDDWPDFPEESWRRGTYLREEGRKVYIYINYEGCERDELLYDFDLSLDDVILLRKPYNYSLCEEEVIAPEDSIYYQFNVTAIDMLDTKLGKRKSISIGYEDDRGEIRWIEGIGSTEGLFYEPPPKPTDMGTFLVACYEDGKLIYGNHNPDGCPRIGVEKMPSSRLTVHPLPNGIVVQNVPEGETITVYDAAGKLVATAVAGESETFIPLSSKGIYIIKVIGRTFFHNSASFAF